jgi:hypothetical protein
MRILIFFILCSFSSEAQIIRANPFYVGRVAAVGGGFLLDDYPNAAAAYSLRKLKSSYSGSAIRVRRDSTGNAETDIGFDANGELDTVALKNHCRNNSCMVTTWYNQGDSASVDFTQTTAASQPRIMTTGTIERRSGKPAIRFDVSGTSDFMDVASSTVKFNYLHQAGQAAVFGVFQAGVNNTNPGVQYAILDNESFTALTFHGFSLTYNDATQNNAIRSASTRSASPATSVQSPADFFAADTLALITNLLNNSTGTAADRNILYYNGANEQKLNTSTGLASALNASFNFRLGRRASGTDFNLNGFVSELILYPTDQTSNRTGIETNIINFFGL